MSTIRLDRPRLPEIKAERRPLSAILLAAALTVLTAAAIAWSVLKIAQQEPQPTLAQCAIVPTESERLACFDQLSKQAVQPPAKGGNAPAMAR